MTRERRLTAALALLITILVTGTIGYTAIEGAPPFDALYMTVITISTVGYSEVFPLSTAGEAFTAFLILVGVGAGLYTAAIALEIGIERIVGSGVLLRESETERFLERDLVVADWQVVELVFAGGIRERHLREIVGGTKHVVEACGV